MADPTISFTGDATSLLKAYAEVDAAIKKQAAALTALKKENNEAAKAEREASREAEQIKKRAVSAQDQYTSAVGRAKELLEKNKISQKEYNHELERQNRLLMESQGAADGMGSKLAGAGKEALVAITGIGSTMAGVAAVFSTIKAEYEELKARDERARQAQLSFGDVMRDLSTGFTPDATLGRGDLQGAVTQIMKQSGAGGSTAALALSDALAGRGSLPASAAVGMASAAATINPGNLEDTREMAFRGMQMMDALGLQDPKQALGLLAQVKNVATVAKMRDVGQTAVPSMLSLKTYGDTPEQSAELFSTVNNLLKDKEGSRSRTAIEQLSLQLSEYLPQMGSTTERLAAVMGDPKAHGKFIEGATFESAAKAQMRELLSGASTPRALMATARAGITSPQMSVGAYDAMVAETLAIDSVRLADVNRRTDANRELRLIAESAAGQSGQSAATIDKDMETIGYRAPQWMARMASGLTRFAGRVAGASPDAIDNASAIIAPVAVESAFQAAVFGGGSSSAVDRETLRYQQEQLQELRRMNRGGPPENALGRQPAGK